MNLVSAGRGTSIVLSTLVGVSMIVMGALLTAPTSLIAFVVLSAFGICTQSISDQSQQTLSSD